MIDKRIDKETDRQTERHREKRVSNHQNYIKPMKEVKQSKILDGEILEENKNGLRFLSTLLL